jgi:glycosyltransferase involved in cell wall biosynthesis
MPNRHRHPVLYVLHSSQLYGTERMALATARTLEDEFETIFIGPPGIGLLEAQRQGYQTYEYRTSRDLAGVLGPLLRKYRSLTFAGTGPRYNLVCIALNIYFRRQIRQLQIVHGGAGERNDYARKKVLNPFNVTLIGVSDYVKEKLIQYGVRPDRIDVVNNFLLPDRIENAPRREPFTSGVRRAVAVSRAVQLKRLDLLFDAVDHSPELRDFPIEIIGDGPELLPLSERAAGSYPNLAFLGFREDVASRYAQADLLVHTCPTEPFGLVILEAMAARVPVLVPNQGGAASLVEDGISGFVYRANDAEHLAHRLAELRNAEPALLNRVAENAARQLETRFSAEAARARYRRLFAPEEQEVASLAGALGHLRHWAGSLLSMMPLHRAPKFGHR